MKKLFLITLALITNFVNAQIFTKYVDNSNKGLGFAYTVTVKATLIKMAASSTLKSGGNGTEYSVELIRVDIDKNKGWMLNDKYYNCSQLEGICNTKTFTNINLQLSYNCNGRDQGTNSYTFYNIGDVKIISCNAKSDCSSPIASGIDYCVINDHDVYNKINPILEKINKSQTNSNSPNITSQTTSKDNQTNETKSYELKLSDIGIAENNSSTTNEWQQNYQLGQDLENTLNQSYYTMQAINETRNTVQENMTLSGSYTSVEELEREYNTKFQALDQSINDMHRQEQDQNLNTINYYSTQTTGNTQVYGTLASGALYFINQAQNKREEEWAKEQLRIQKEQAAIEIANRKIAQRQAMRANLFNMFPDGGVPMSSHRISIDDLYFFVYNFDEASIKDGRPKIAMSNVFPIAKYGDGTWPFKSVVVGEVQKIHKTGKTTLVGYYTTKEMADGMRASFIRMAVKSEMTIEDFVYKGRPRNNSSTSSSVDFWGNSGNAEKPNPSTENNTQTDFWDNPVKTPTTQPTKPIKKEPEPAKPKVDFWGNPIKE